MNKTTVPRTLFLAATFLYWVSLYLYIPTLPTYILTRTATLAVVGTVLAMYGLWQALLRIPVGISVDRVGNGKVFIVVGMLVASVGALVMGVGKTVFALTLGNQPCGAVWNVGHNLRLHAGACRTAGSHRRN